MPGKRLSFGPFTVDEGAHVVLRDGEPLAVGQRGAQILAVLLRRPGEIVTKTELIDAAWGGAAIEESNLSVQVANLRRALGPIAGGGDWIATVPRVGYRFVGPAERPAPTQADERPSIAVLPFENLSSDIEQGYFADGLAEEVITALSKLTGLRAAARNSSFAFRGAAIDVRKVATDLGVSHVLTGSVRRSGDQVRMNVQLAHAPSGDQLWAERYDRTMNDIFAIQDDVTARIVAALKVTLTPAEAARSAGGTTDPEALDLLLRGRSMLGGTSINAEGVFPRALGLLRRAVEKDPGYADAYSELGLAYVFDHANRWTSEAGEALDRGRRAAERAVELAPQSARAHDLLAVVADFGKDQETSVRETERALAIDPNHGGAPMSHGRLCFLRGDPLAAVPHFEEGLRRDPSVGATVFFLQMLAIAYFFGRRFETAVALLRERIVLMPGTDWSRAFLISALGHLGQAEEARAVYAELLQLRPTYDLAGRYDRGPNQVPGQREIFFEGWRLAGIDPDQPLTPAS